MIKPKAAIIQFNDRVEALICAAAKKKLIFRKMLTIALRLTNIPNINPIPIKSSPIDTSQAKTVAFGIKLLLIRLTNQALGLPLAKKPKVPAIPVTYSGSINFSRPAINHSTPIMRLKKTSQTEVS